MLLVSFDAWFVNGNRQPVLSSPALALAAISLGFAVNVFGMRFGSDVIPEALKKFRNNSHLKG